MAKLIIAALAVYLLAGAILQAGIDPVMPAFSGGTDISGCIVSRPQEG
jgi:hypothetical protein